MANILIVDDDEQACTVVASLFGHAGHKICVAYNGQSAIDKIAVDRPGVVLLDLLMPVMDGWQVLRWIRARHTTVDLPINVYSAISEEKMLDLARELGANDCWLKGEFSFEQMLAKIVPFVKQDAKRAA